jgi:hypothetical protein
MKMGQFISPESIMALILFMRLVNLKRNGILFVMNFAVFIQRWAIAEQYIF